MASFEESFARSFNTSLASSQQQLPRLLKMQQDMRDKMSEEQRRAAALNTIEGALSNLDGVTSESSSKQVVGMQEGQKILDAYQDIIELPDEVRRDKQTVAKTFRAAAGFDPSEVVLSNVTKRDPIALQVELDVFREDVINGRVTAGQIRKVMKDPGASTKAIASTKDRKPGRINSPQQTEALLTIDKGRNYLSGLNEVEAKLAGHPDFEVMKPRLDAVRKRVMDQIDLANDAFNRDMEMAQLSLERQKFAASTDPALQGRIAGAEEGGKIDAALARSEDVAASAAARKAAEAFGATTGKGRALANLIDSSNPTESEVGRKLASANVTPKVNPVLVETTTNVLEDLALKKRQATDTRTEISLARAGIEAGTFETGAFGDFRLAASSVAKLFGFDPNVIPGLGDPKAGQIIDRANVALAFQQSLQTGGRMSNERMRLLLKMFVSVDMDPDASKLMVEVMERKATQNEILWREGMTFIANSDPETLMNEKGETVIDHLDRVARDFPVVTKEMEERISGVAGRLDKIREKLKIAENTKILKADVARAKKREDITAEEYADIVLELNLKDED